MINALNHAIEAKSHVEKVATRQQTFQEEASADLKEI